MSALPINPIAVKKSERTVMMTPLAYVPDPGGFLQENLLYPVPHTLCPKTFFAKFHPTAEI